MNTHDCYLFCSRKSIVSFSVSGVFGSHAHETSHYQLYVYRPNVWTSNYLVDPNIFPDSLVSDDVTSSDENGHEGSLIWTILDFIVRLLVEIIL